MVIVGVQRPQASKGNPKIVYPRKGEAKRKIKQPGTEGFPRGGMVMYVFVCGGKGETERTETRVDPGQGIRNPVPEWDSLRKRKRTKPAPSVQVCQSAIGWACATEHIAASAAASDRLAAKKPLASARV